jgi:hypothetical protein
MNARFPSERAKNLVSGVDLIIARISARNGDNLCVRTLLINRADDLRAVRGCIKGMQECSHALGLANSPSYFKQEE